MKYQIDSFVKITESNQVKKIVDYEKLGEVNLYYMSDISAYPEDKISKLDEKDVVGLIKNKFLSEERINTLGKNMAKGLEKYKS